MRVLSVWSRMHATANRRGGSRLIEIVRMCTFAAIGVLVTVTNIALVWVFSLQHRIPYIAYVTISTECTLLLSFVLNDRLTFHNLEGATRAWYVRCLRFHLVSAVAAGLTIGVSTTIHQITHCAPVLAQTAAIPISSTANFVLHRFWTYRKRHARYESIDASLPA